MLPRLVSRLNLARQVLSHHARRNIGISAVVAQKADLDPIQQLFVEKIRDYAKKSKAVGGKLVDANPEVEHRLQEELEKINRVYGVKEGVDMTEFPTFNFKDVPLEPVGLGEIKETLVQTQVTEEEEITEEDPANIPYYEV